MAAVLADTDGVDADGDDDEKPTWDDDIDIGDIVPPPPSREEASHAELAAKERKKAKKKERKKRMREDEDSAVDVDEMDADATSYGGRKWDEVEWDGTEEMRKRVLDQYMDELYDLEFNDMVRPSLSRRFLMQFLYTRLPLRLQGCPHTSAMSL
jgi:protein KRI1